MKIKKSPLDKFYTSKDVAAWCISQLDITEYDIVIEPSAGDGAFSSQIYGCLALDISPENNSIICRDFLKFTPEVAGKVLVIGNPPFGNNSSMVFKFFKKASEFADTIAFIVPKSFKKRSFRDRVPRNFHLSLELDIPKNSFLLNGNPYDVPCVFQIWYKSDDIRPKSVKVEPTLFSFVKKSDNPILSIRRVGVNAGKLFTDTNRSEQSHYFIKTDHLDWFMKRWYSLEWEHDNTAGCNSISKQEIVSKMETYILYE